MNSLMHNSYSIYFYSDNSKLMFKSFTTYAETRTNIKLNFSGGKVHKKLETQEKVRYRHGFFVCVNRKAFFLTLTRP